MELLTNEDLAFPRLCFVLASDDQGITTLGDEAKVHKIPEDLMVFLRVLEGAEQGKVYQIQQTPLTIGRDKLCSLSFRDSRMSRQHAAIFYFAPDFFLKDLASTNGTFLNDKRTSQAKLTSGDKIRMGGTVFEFIINKRAEAK